MKITFEISDQHAEIIAAALLDIIDQMQPTRLEPMRVPLLTLKVNGTYYTEDEKIARCVDLRESRYICEIEGKEYAFWQSGIPSKTSTTKEFYQHAIIAKIIQ